MTYIPTYLLKTYLSTYLLIYLGKVSKQKNTRLNALKNSYEILFFYVLFLG
jgi:hypothetical protein